MTRILIVEDSPTQAEALRLILEQAGFTVDVAEDGASALALTDSDAFDVVISDIVMPGMSGYDLCRAVKNNAKNPGTPVILLSSLSDPMDIIRGLECEADNFVTKPYDADRLIARIMSILENRRVRASSTVKFGVELVFLGKRFVITSDREQILDLLITTFEDTVRTNVGLQESQDQLASAKSQLETYARELEQRVRARTLELEKKAEELRFALEASHKSEMRFRSMVSNLALPMWVCDKETLEFLHVSDAAAREYGYELREFLQLTAKDLVATEDHEGRLAAPVLPEPARRLQQRHRRKNGEVVTVELVATAIEYQDRPAFLVIANDITERLRAEAQVRHAERLEALGSLTGGIAHDFNNLLTVINSSAEDLCHDLTESPLRHSAEMVRQAADRGADLVRHLLSFARKQELRFEALDVNLMVGNVVKLARRTLPTNIAIRTRETNHLPAVRIDAGRLENALLNLALNARDAMPEGGELSIATSLIALDARNAERMLPGAYVLVAVSDTGTGMLPDVIDHAFEPFFTTKGMGQGTGLGLSSVYGLVKQSGGHAKIDSEVGQGTTITLYLPAEPAEPVAPSDEDFEALPTELPHGSGSVLLVEDDDLVRESVSLKLARFGYEVTQAGSAAEAIAALEHDASFDLVFSDVMMPGVMNGVDLAREIATRWPHVAVLLSSGRAELDNGAKVRIPETVRCLSKPYSAAKLAQAIGESLKPTGRSKASA